MSRQLVIVLYVMAMAAVIVGLDFGFFRDRFLGTADSEYWNCLGVRSVLFQIPEMMIETGGCDNPSPD